MHIRVLGSIEALGADAINLGGPTQRRALALLALHVNQVVSIDKLIEAVWFDEQAPERAEHNVRTYVHRLRTAFGEAGDRIETVSGGYLLRLTRSEFDATRFEDLLAEARVAAAEADNERAQHLLAEALDLWRGPPYPDLGDHDAARAEIARLEELRASAVERRFEALLAAGRHTELIAPINEAIADAPWREARRAQLALALYRSGRQAEALKALHDYRAALADELGLDPSPDLDALEHRILDHDPSLKPASHQQHMLRGYQLGEVIGEGAFSLVWRGVQPSLGRTVAVKQIRANLANQPDFVRRFETEAQTVAALEHPYIVPLYDYWREPDNAYLVMRYVPGGSLESEVLERGLDETRLRRMVEQVGSALHVAHRSGVIHRDVKSANVLLDDDGNFYLTDFGIAFTGSVSDDELATALSTGSPAYASPEQLRRQALDSRTDVYGFGITLFEAATGRLPFVDAPTRAAIVKRQLEDPVPAPSSVAPTVPAWVDQVVARATAKNPSDRFGSMIELMAAVPPDATSTAGHGRDAAAATVIGDLANPFKALQAFREADAADFFGRERLVTRFVEVLARPGTAGRLLAVVGPSGSGKSSAVRSGLVPRLRTGAVSGSQDWFITTMIPGSHPFDELESALSRVAVRQPGPLVEMMAGDERGIARAVNQILPDEDTELLLIIDQFEEVFTHTPESERQRFLDGIIAAVREPRARLRVAVTIRADFWDRPLRHPELASRLETAAITVAPLAADELEAAIVQPVRRQGGAYEPGLVARIMADVGDQPGALPLLQYALTELFDANVSGLLQTETYDAIGGLTGALATRAETTLTAMTPKQQAVTRRIFGRLVTFGEGTDDTRRRVMLSELGDDDDSSTVVDTFGTTRLLVFDHDPATREPTVEIAHESLLRAWPRLRSWLDEDRDGLRIHRHLTDTTATWLLANRDAGELYRGGRLEAAVTWVADHRGDLNPAEAEFLDASVAAHEAELAAEQERLDATVRSNRRLRVLVSVATVIAVVAAVAGVFALQQRSRADDNAAEAQARADEAEAALVEAEQARQSEDVQRVRADENAAQAQVRADEAEAALVEAERARQSGDIQRVRASAFEVADENPALALLLAAEAQRLNPSRDNESALHRLLLNTGGVEATMSGIYGDLWLLDGGLTAVASGFDGLDFWNLRTLEKARTIERPSQVRTRRDLSIESSLAVFTDGSGTDLFDVFTGERHFSMATEAVDVSFDPSGAMLALAFDDRLEIWDVTDPTQPMTSETMAGGATHVSWAPSGTEFVVVASDGTIRYHELGAEAPLWSTEPTDEENDSPRTLFGSDGSTVVVAQFPRDGGAGQEIQVLTTADGARLTIERTPAMNDVLQMSWFDEDALQISATINPGALKVFDLNLGESIEAPYRSESAWATEYSQVLDRVVEAGVLGVQIRHPSGASPLQRLLPPTPEQGIADGQFAYLEHSLSADGERLLLSRLAPPFAVVEYDLTVEPATYTVTDLTGIAVGTHGFTMLGNPLDGSMVMLDRDGHPVGEPIPFDRSFGFAAPSPLGGFFAIFKQDGSIELYRSSGELVDKLRVPDAEPSETWVNISFSSDDSEMMVYLVGGNEEWAAFDTETGDLIRDGDPDQLVKPSFSGDTLYAATRDDRFTVVRLDPATFEPVGDPLVGHTSSLQTVVDAGGLIATNSFDGTARVWDADTGEPVGGPIETPAYAVQFADDGRLLSTIHDGWISVWNYDTSTWADIACKVAGRNMTEAEWAEYGPRRIDYQVTCPQFESGT